MRDPKRIPIVMDDIMHAWKKCPDYRLGQMISNAMHGCGTDLFYIEDEELVEKITNHLKEGKHYGDSTITR